VNVFVAFLLLVPFLIAALHFAGKALERYGYSREDIRRLPEIIEKTHGRLYLPKEVFDTVTRALIFWGLIATVVIMAENPLKGLSQRGRYICQNIGTFRYPRFHGYLGYGLSVCSL